MIYRFNLKRALLIRAFFVVATTYFLLLLPPFIEIPCYTQISEQVIDRRIGKVKGRPVMRLITFGASPPVTSCSVTFSPRKAETYVRP